MFGVRSPILLWEGLFSRVFIYWAYNCRNIKTGASMSDEDNKKLLNQMPNMFGRRTLYSSPDIAGEIQFRFYRCQEHGVYKVYEENRINRI